MLKIERREPIESKRLARMKREPREPCAFALEGERKETVITVKYPVLKG